MGLGEWRSSQEEKPVNMKQANLAQKDNLSQSQLLHTQNDRQMKTQAAGKQVKASEGGERETRMLLEQFVRHNDAATLKLEKYVCRRQCGRQNKTNFVIFFS